MSPSERQAKAIQKANQKALTLDEEARITEGEYIRREKPIGERGHLKRMLEYLKEREAQKHKQEQEDCPHDEHDHGICLECGKDIMDDLIDRAELLRDE